MNKLNQKDKKIIITILSLTTIITLFLLIKIINIIQYPLGKPSDISYTNTTKDNVNYLVYLMSNDFFQQPYLDPKSSYITSLVEYIKTKFTYEYNMNNCQTLNYTYKIVANINVQSTDIASKTTNPIWQYNDIILDPVTRNNVTLPLKIDEDLDISIAPYTALIDDFNQTYNIPISAQLNINLVVDIKGKTLNNEDITKQQILTMSLPIGVKVFDITISKNYDPEEVVYTGDKPNKQNRYAEAIIYIGIMIISIGGSVYLIKSIVDRNYGQYSLKKKKILKEYDDRIVQVSRFIKLDNWEIVDVKDFEELLDLSNEAFEPIFFWEKRFNHTKEAWFSILRDKVLYRYVIKRNNEESNY